MDVGIDVGRSKVLSVVEMNIGWWRRRERRKDGREEV